MTETQDTQIDPEAQVDLNEDIHDYPEEEALAEEELLEAFAPMPEPEPDIPEFDLMGIENPSYAVLQAGRTSVFASVKRLASFKNKIEVLPDSGEEGRRKGLGSWMVCDFEGAARQLARYEGDDAASFVRARSLMALERYGEAIPILEKLTKSYPDEPRPRGGLIESTFLKRLAEADNEAEEAEAAAWLAKEVGATPAGFQESAEGNYLRGWSAELARDWETALDHYEAARVADATLRANLFRGAYLAERSGLDEAALVFYETLLIQKPTDRNTLLNAGVLYEDLGRDDDAAACYDIVARFYPTDRRARLYLEDARAGMGMYYDEDLERKEDKLNQILRIPITDFELSVRARNCLNKMMIRTLGDLVCRTEQELLSYKNFGETSLNEIKEILHSKGLRLGMPREEAVASIEAYSRRSSRTDESDVMNKPVMELQLSIRARRTVEALGCLTLGEITKHNADELLGMPNFGVTSLQELRSKLAEFGLKLTGE